MLRRTHATGLYRDGVAIEAIASTLGHASIQTTKDHYAFPSLAQKQEVVNVGGVVITESVNQEWPDDEDELAPHLWAKIIFIRIFFSGKRAYLSIKGRNMRITKGCG